MSYDYDVVVAAPLSARGLGGHSVAHAVQALGAAGYRIGLVDLECAALEHRGLPFPDAWVQILRAGSVELLPPSASVRAQMLVLARPTLSTGVSAIRQRVEPDHALVTLDTDDASAMGRVSAIVDDVLQYCGVSPVVAVSRRTGALPEGDLADLMLGEEFMFFPAAETTVHSRTLQAAERPTVGRHSRLTEPEWTTDVDRLRTLYPDSEQVAVQIFGKYSRLRRLLGQIPASWDMRPRTPSLDDLGLDFWVYGGDVEPDHAFDTAIDEAIASGAVVILPEEFAAHYGDAAVYTHGDDVASIIDGFLAHPDMYAEQSARCVKFAEAHSSERVVEMLSGVGLGTPLAPASTAEIAPTPAAPRHSQGRTRRRVMLVSSNGAGMGHLTRLLGIARRLPAEVEPIFVSLSQAVPVVAEQENIPFEYVASRNDLGASPSDWNRYCASRFEIAIDKFRPDALVFDGVWPYAGILQAGRKKNLPLIWSRRGMWKAHVDDRSLALSDRFRAVIEPGDFAAANDRGATVRETDKHLVAPVTVLDRSEILDRDEAREALGIPHDVRAALVTLGAGNINNVDDVTRVMVERIKSVAEWHVYVTHAAISHRTMQQDIHTLQVYPLARYANAFDFAVSASGYNSYHEWMAYCLPALWIPNVHTLTDDQAARARFAEEIGVGLSLEDPSPSEVTEALAVMMNDGRRAEMKARLEEMTGENGAQAAADLVAQLVGFDSESGGSRA